jgi:hypothetical protein
MNVQSACALNAQYLRRRPQWSEGLVDWTKHHRQEIQGICQHVSGRSSDQSTQLGHLSHYHGRSKKNYNSVQCRLSGKIFFCIGSIWRISLSSNDFYSDSSLVEDLIRVKILMFCLGSCRWFVLCLACIPYLVSVQVSRDGD